MCHRFWISIALGFMALCAHGAELVIAQVAPFSGPLGANGSANYVGAKACFDQVNAEGGIGGHTIDFSGGNVGSQFVDIGVITRAGRLMY